MKQWDNIWGLWQELKVPSIQTKEFIIGGHTVNSPWFSIKEKEQIYFDRPVRSTAYHIAVHLKGKEEELIAAYKLYAYITYFDFYSFLDDPIEFGMKKYNEKLDGWWHPNARIVLPDYSERFVDYDAREKDWKRIVTDAAETWRQLAKEWEIIIIPNFMDQDSEKYKEFKDYSNKAYEEIEYQKYLELKKKFENK